MALVALSSCSGTHSPEPNRFVEVSVSASVLEPESGFSYNIPLENAAVVVTMPDGSTRTGDPDAEGNAYIDLGRVIGDVVVRVAVTHELIADSRSAGRGEGREVTIPSGATGTSIQVMAGSFRLDRLEG